MNDGMGNCSLSLIFLRHSTCLQKVFLDVFLIIITACTWGKTALFRLHILIRCESENHCNTTFEPAVMEDEFRINQTEILFVAEAKKVNEIENSGKLLTDIAVLLNVISEG